MLNVNHMTGHIIATETTALFDATDDTLLNSARLTIGLMESLALIEASSETRINPRTKQKMLDALISGQSQLVESRRNFTSVWSQLLVLQRQNNLAETNWGCQDLRSDAEVHSAGETLCEACG